MKKSTGYLKYTAVLALMATLVALVFWITGMYRSSTDNYLQTAEKCLALATDTELSIRMVSLGNKFKHWIEPPTDTSTYITKTIQFEDSSINIRINRNDPTAFTKIRQFYFHLADCPLNTFVVDSLFKRCMSENSLPVKASYIEYLDLKKNTLISSNAPEGKLSGYFASNVDTLDILKTIGVRANAKIPLLVLLRPVMTELVVAVSLMLIVLACIIKLIVDIKKMHAEGFRLLRFVSLKAEHSLHEAAQQIGDVAERLHDKGLEEESTEAGKAKEGVLISTGYFERLRAILDNEDGKIAFNKTVFDIRTLLDELKEQYEKIIYKDVVVNVTADYGILIYTDRYYLKRVFEEILDNSVKYSSDIVRVQIIIMQKDQRIVMVACDHGGGIAQSDLDNMYIVNHDIARFYKEAIKRETKTGLGFSFVISFVRALGGDVKITSDDGMAGVKMIFTQTSDDLQRIADHDHIGLTGNLQVKTINFTERIAP